MSAGLKSTVSSPVVWKPMSYDWLHSDYKCWWALTFSAQQIMGPYCIKLWRPGPTTCWTVANMQPLKHRLSPKVLGVNGLLGNDWNVEIIMLLVTFRMILINCDHCCCAVELHHSLQLWIKNAKRSMSSKNKSIIYFLQNTSFYINSFIFLVMKLNVHFGTNT